MDPGRSRDSSSRGCRDTYTTTGTSGSGSRTNQTSYKPTTESTRKPRVDCQESQSSSHTHFYRRDIYENVYERITRNEYLGISESISESSNSYHCVHGSEGKQYTQEGLLKRNLQKNLDPMPKDVKWEENCPPSYGWNMANRLEFLILDPLVDLQTERIISHVKEFAVTSSKGFKVDTLNSVTLIVDYLVESQDKVCALRECLMLMLQNMDKPILLNVSTDVLTYFEDLGHYMGFLGYLMIRLEDDAQFELVAQAVIWQLSSSDRIRSHAAAQLRHTLAAAMPSLYHTVVRMLAVVPGHRYSKFLELAFILACDTVQNCIDLMKENIIENIFYRFNPYFPERQLPSYDINPDYPQDINVKLGASSVHISTVSSLLLVLMKTMKQCLEDNKITRRDLPCPDDCAQRCFIWAYRYECRAREHKHQRVTLTVIIQGLLHFFRDRLSTFSNILMPDVMSLSVLTELPARSDWTNVVNFNTAQRDVYFKKILIYLSVDFLKVFPFNHFMVESRNWLVGLMYLVDPGLCYLRARWSTSLFAELRRASLQALLLTVRLLPPELIIKCNLIRRIMWYIEWYCESPYELVVLYFCVRLLQTCLFPRHHECRSYAMQEMFNTHGIIIIMKLCHKLMEQKIPPVEKSQSIIAVSMRLLTSAAEHKLKVSCCVYPELKWPSSIMSLTRKMMEVVLYSLDKHHIVSDRWLLSFLNFIWENIIWKPEHRKLFIADDGIYKLLDMITVTRYPVQCMALAMICDIALTGEGVGHLVTWRANLRAQSAAPRLVKQGSTIVTLLASLFRRDCDAMGVVLDENGIIQDIEHPMLSQDMSYYLKDAEDAQGRNQRTPYCLVAADIAGSRCSKAYAMLQLLSEDLKDKVAIADEAYKLYHDIKLSMEDEILLVLVSNYLTIKLCQTWVETQIQCKYLVPDDENILEEFMHIDKSWMKEIKRQQEEIQMRVQKQECSVEKDLYSFLARVRLNVALDALREVRCVARSADRGHMAFALLHDAVYAYHRRSTMVKRLQAPVIRTFGPTLDDQNITAKNVKVFSILPRDKPKPMEYILHPVSSSSATPHEHGSNENAF